jgi:hypothetical integral membrane protein (TIGR02206 family)
MVPMPEWMPENFRPFSLLHAIVVAVFIAATVAFCWVGRGRPRVRMTLGVIGSVVFAAHQVFWLLPANFTWSRSLPLHVCDLAGIVAPIALLSGGRWARSLLYFWGLCLSSQGFITPVLTEGPGTVIFWFFFGSHAVIVGSAVYDIVAGGFRPTWRDYWSAVAITLIYLIAMFVLDFITGWNYGYVGDARTSQPTALDWLGPWPWRVLVMVMVGAAGFAVAMGPWEILGKWRRKAKEE